MIGVEKYLFDFRGANKLIGVCLFNKKQLNR